ncbi:MAG TPA: DNA polymerase III subunit beta [Propionibacteriaceae bacterium]|jgi:DNA polymerase-3 subunit beta
MKIRAQRAELAQTLTWVTSAISKRPVNPALGGIRLTATDDQLQLRAFGDSVAHEMRLDVEVGDEGDCLVNGQFLREIVSALKGSEVDLDYDDSVGRLTISSGRATYRASALTLQDFPRLPDFPTECGRASAEDFAAAVSVVKHAPDDAGDFDNLRGIRLEGESGGIAVAGLMPQRIAATSLPWAHHPAETDLQCQVPTLGLAAAVKGMSGELTIGYDDGRFGLRDSVRAVTLACYAEDYPAWRAAIPDATVPGVTFDVAVADLLDALKRTSLLVTMETAVVLTVTADELVIDTDTEGSDGSEGVAIDGVTGEGAARLNPRLMVDALSTIPGGRVRMHIPDALNKAVTMRPLDYPHTTYAVARKPGTKGRS